MMEEFSLTAGLVLHRPPIVMEIMISFYNEKCVTMLIIESFDEIGMPFSRVSTAIRTRINTFPKLGGYSRRIS